MANDPKLPSFFDEASERTIAADVRALPRGFRIDEFEILEVIGSGGFAIVYKAFDHSLGQERAIKEYLPRALAGRFSTQLVTVLSKEDEATYDEGLRKFVAEARLLAGINHPAVVRVHRCIEANHTAYMVMDLCTGESLEQRLARNVGFDEPTLRRFLTELLGGVEALHARKILHRDIKPANIFVSEDGHPVLIDFGSAREVAQPDQALTAIVTYNYSAPEQWDSTGQFSQGPYSDLYSIGATCYQMVTGRKPNSSNTRLLKDTLVPAHEAAAGRYSQQLLESIDKALTVAVNERYQTAREWLDDLPRREAAAARQGRGKWYALAAVLLVALAIGGLVYVKRHRAEVAAAAAAQAQAEADAKPSGPAPGSLLRDCPTCPEVVVIGNGAFQQGATGNAAEKDELPRHPVKIAYPFAVSRFEVTLSQFREFVNASGYNFGGDAACGRKRAGAPDRSWKDPGFPQRDDEPVVCASWFDATGYAAWLSKVTGQRYRLLTESEWEYVARAGSDAAAPWGDDGAKACDYANVADQSYVQRTGSKVAAKCDDGSAFTAPGSVELRRNAFGVHDMLGNAAEWVQDCRTADYAGAPADGAPADSATCQERVFRGGAFNYPVSELRVTRREALPPAERRPYIGIRVARDLEPSPTWAAPGDAGERDARGADAKGEDRAAKVDKGRDAKADKADKSSAGGKASAPAKDAKTPVDVKAKAKAEGHGK